MESNTKQARILVVDDERHIIRAIEFKLSKAGFQVESAYDGKQAWEMISADPPDLLITDFQMPFINGLELIALVRGDERTKQLPTILLTAKQIELKRAESMKELAIAGSIAKPFSPRKLTAIVCELLEDAGYRIPEPAQTIRSIVASGG